MGLTQNDAILAHFQAGHSLTPLEALERFDCFRLGARVYDLKRAGYDIHTESFELPNGKRVARYWLPQPKGQLSLFQTKGPSGVYPSGLSTSLGMDPENLPRVRRVQAPRVTTVENVAVP